MADQSVSFESLNLTQTLADVDAAEAAAEKFLSMNKALDMELRLKPAGAALANVLGSNPAFCALTPAVMAEVLASRSADVMGAVLFLCGRLNQRGIGRTLRDAQALLVAAARKLAPEATVRVMVEAFGQVIAAAK
jgi:hypothetical protein